MRGPARRAALLAVVLVGAGLPAAAQPAAWRLVGGGFNFRWDTDGEHGHTEECRSPACDDRDWRRGNLDNAIGWRLGAERALAAAGRLELVAGGEAEAMFTEYNQSQRDFTLAGAFVTGGAELDLGAVRPLVRAGAGGVATSDGRGGVAWFGEAGLDVRLGAGVALRLAARRAELAGPGSKELALLVVAAPGVRSGAVGWDVGWAWGGSFPGRLAGDDLALSRAPLWRLAAARRVGRHGDRLGVQLGATNHESELYSSLGDAAGNQRGKWVIDVGGRWDRIIGEGSVWRWRVGGGVKAASYFDEDAPFLVDDEGDTVRADWEVGVTAAAGADVRVADGLRVTVELEQVYWPSLELGEARVLLGLEVSL